MSSWDSDSETVRAPIMKPSRGIAREGYPFILIAFLVAAALGFFGGKLVGCVSLILPLFVLNFFRDPDRDPPQDASLVVSPADGKVISVAEVKEERYLHQAMKRICIFMNVLNVHVNRVPVSGRVKTVVYNPG